MELKKYPAKEYSEIITSTVMACCACGDQTGINEPIYRDGAKFYHKSCVSEETETETKVHELHLTDDLNVKSEGR